MIIKTLKIRKLLFVLIALKVQKFSVISYHLKMIVATKLFFNQVTHPETKKLSQKERRLCFTKKSSVTALD